MQAHQCTRLKRPPLECLRCLRNGLSIITRLACLKTCAKRRYARHVYTYKLWHFCCLSHKRHVHWQNSSSKWGRWEKPFTIFKLGLMNIQPARWVNDHQLASLSEAWSTSKQIQLDRGVVTFEQKFSSGYVWLNHQQTPTVYINETSICLREMLTSLISSFVRCSLYMRCNLLSSRGRIDEMGFFSQSFPLC